MTFLEMLKDNILQLNFHTFIGSWAQFEELYRSFVNLRVHLPPKHNSPKIDDFLAIFLCDFFMFSLGASLHSWFYLRFIGSKANISTIFLIFFQFIGSKSIYRQYFDNFPNIFSSIIGVQNRFKVVRYPIYRRNIPNKKRKFNPWSCSFL